MKAILASGAAILLFSSLAHANPQSAFQFGQVLGQTFCSNARTIYANGALPQPHMETFAIESSNDTIICKNALVQAVRSDAFCYNLYYGYASGLTSMSLNSIRNHYTEMMNYCNY